MKRRLVLAGLFLITSLALLLVSLVTYEMRQGCVSQYNFQRIEHGMSAARVEQLFGQPGEPVKAQATGYGSGSTMVLLDVGDRVQGAIDYSPGAYDPSAAWQAWKKGDCYYCVSFVDGCVRHTCMVEEQTQSRYRWILDLVGW